MFFLLNPKKKSFKKCTKQFNDASWSSWTWTYGSYWTSLNASWTFYPLSNYSHHPQEWVEVFLLLLVLLLLPVLVPVLLLLLVLLLLVPVLLLILLLHPT